MGLPERLPRCLVCWLLLCPQAYCRQLARLSPSPQCVTQPDFTNSGTGGLSLRNHGFAIQATGLRFPAERRVSFLTPIKAPLITSICFLSQCLPFPRMIDNKSISSLYLHLHFCQICIELLLSARQLFKSEQDSHGSSLLLDFTYVWVSNKKLVHR